MSEVTIIVTAMGFRVPLSRDGCILGTKTHIGRFAAKFEQWEYDRQLNKDILINEYFYFDKVRGVVHFPRYALDDFKSYLFSSGLRLIVVEDPGVVGKEVEFQMLPHISYKNEKQRAAVEYLTNESSGPLRGLALQTGSGKTISHIWALQKLGRRSMTTMTSRMEQWIKETGVYTTLEEDDLYLIQGEASLTKLFNQIDKKIFPKLIIASTKTIRLYLEYGEGYRHLPHPTNFCEELNIGIIGSDEYHEHFNSNLMMMLAFNPRIFIPITATFVASSPYVRNIFNGMIPKSVQFSGGEYDKFVDVVTYRYTGGAHSIKPFNYMRAKGYSQNKFEEYLLSKKGESILNALLNDAILPIIKEHYIRIAEKGEKFLMICSSKEFCDYLAGVFKRVFRDKTVSVFYSGMPSNVLERYDMILSTPGSAGCLTGDTIVSISRNGTSNGAGSYECTLKNAYLHFNGLSNKRQYNWDREVPTYTRSFNGASVQLSQIGDIVYSGVKDVYKVTLANGFSIKCTCDHPIMTTDGWTEAKDIIGKQVMCEVNRLAVKGEGRKALRDTLIRVSSNHPYAVKTSTKSKGKKYFGWRIELHRAIYEAVVLNKMTLDVYLEALKDPLKVKDMIFVDSSIYDIHHIDNDHDNNDPSNLIHMDKIEHKKLHSLRSRFNFNQGIPEYSEAVSIEYVGEEDTYDIHCLDTSHNFVANGIVVHNTGRDIKGLRTCFAFENTGSEVRNLQFIGRLRGPPQMLNTPVFINLYFACIPQHVNYNNARSMLYGPRALSYKQRNIG